MRKAQRKANSAGVKTPVKTRPKRDESRYNKGSCEMVLVADNDAVYAGPLGAFCWCMTGTLNEDKVEQQCRTLWAKYPDGSVGCIPIRPVPAAIAKTFRDQTWEWDGNLEKPTIRPSVHHVGRWHGWITAGRMVSC